jgi:hypothetical protein
VFWPKSHAELAQNATHFGPKRISELQKLYNLELQTHTHSVFFFEKALSFLQLFNTQSACNPQIIRIFAHACIIKNIRARKAALFL